MTNSASINFMGINIATLVLIAIGAVITIFAMIWGTMRRRAKAAAIAESERHEAAIRDADAEVAAHGHAPVAEPPLEPPLEPAAIPLAPAAVPIIEGDSANSPPTDTYPLTTLKGLGPRAETALAAQGIASIGDLAALDPARADAIDAQLGPLAGRIARDRWVEQARLLSAGDLKGFEAAFGKIGD